MGPSLTRHLTPLRLLLLGTLFHLLYLPSIFDVYFVSPVVHVDKHFGIHGQADAEGYEAPAKRVVLVVGDGLRADKALSLFPCAENPETLEPLAPHLREVIEHRGVYGVSHTRVPTESRPGHVAILGGMYEDVSAVTTGWKLNPISHDSVFNHSSSTFAIGSPDVIDMFAADNAKVSAYTYAEDEEDFAKDATALDHWVLHTLQHLLSNASTDLALDARLRAPQTVFFLHLLGCDSTGHAYRPHSPEYHANVRVVDEVVRGAEQALDEFYGGDGRTAWVFTADHGMSNIGNHGDGDPDATRTPFISWGAGIRSPLPSTSSPSSLPPLLPPSSRTPPDSPASWAEPWKLAHLARTDIPQADLAPLLSVLVGLPLPGNSEGVLPLGVLQGTDEWKARAALGNARGVLEQFRVKQARKRARTLFFTPFPELSSPSSSAPGAELVRRAELAIEQGAYDEVVRVSGDIIGRSLRGLKYLQRYDWLLLRSLVTLGYVGWTALAALYILRTFGSPAPPSPVPSSTLRSILSLVPYGLFALLSALFVYQRAPPTFYVYAGFPALFWSEVLRSFPSSAARWRKAKVVGVVGRLAGVGVALGGMVAGYTRRPLWSLGFFLLALHPLLALSRDTQRANKRVLLAWAVSCAATGVFPLLPVEKGESLGLIAAGGAALIVFGHAALWNLDWLGGGAMRERGRAQAVLLAETLMVYLSLGLTLSSAQSLQAKQGLPKVNQALSWGILVISTLLPLLPPSRTSAHPPAIRLSIYALSFAPAFVILTLSHESLFYCAFAGTLFLWLRVEGLVEAQAAAGAAVGKEGGRAQKGRSRIVRWDDVRRATWFLFFVHVGFFGTGNVASISSFYLGSVFRLMTVFNPFPMAALLLYKILIPFLVLSAVFGTLNAHLGLPPFALFLLVLAMTDVLTLAFFFLVTDEGSWLEIGQTISHFAIASLLLVFNAGVYALGQAMMREEGPVPGRKVEHGKGKGGSDKRV